MSRTPDYTIDTDQPFYHVTERVKADDILESYLGTGEDVDELNVYHGRRGNREHIYLWNEPNIHRQSGYVIDPDPESHVWTLDDHTVLEVDLPDDHPVERDYDQLLHVLRYPDEKDWRTEWIEPFLSRHGVEFSGPLEEENLRDHIDQIPEDEWREKTGSYRTDTAVPADRITEIGFEPFLPPN